MRSSREKLLLGSNIYDLSDREEGEEEEDEDDVEDDV